MKEKTKVLLIIPLIDIPTITSNYAAYDLLAYMDTKWNLDVDVLHGIAANRIAFNLYTRAKKYDVIMYFGHGEQKRLMGNHVIWSMINEKNIKNARDSIFLTMACYSGKELGKIAIEKGVRAYIGAIDIIHANFPEKERNYLTDWRNQYTCYFKAVLDGKSVGEAFSIFQQEISRYIKIYEKKKGYRNYDWYLNSARHNLSVMKLWGDKNAKIGNNKKT